MIFRNSHSQAGNARDPPSSAEGCRCLCTRWLAGAKRSCRARGRDSAENGRKLRGMSDWKIKPFQFVWRWSIPLYPTDGDLKRESYDEPSEFGIFFQTTSFWVAVFHDVYDDVPWKAAKIATSRIILHEDRCLAYDDLLGSEHMRDSNQHKEDIAKPRIQVLEINRQQHRAETTLSEFEHFWQILFHLHCPVTFFGPFEDCHTAKTFAVRSWSRTRAAAPMLRGIPKIVHSDLPSPNGSNL